MKKYWWIPVVVCSLLSAGCTLLSHRSQAAVYPKIRVLQYSCDAAWPHLLRTVGEAGFRLVAKDDAGQIARFLYLEPQLPPIVRTGADPDNLAITADGSGQKAGRLRIESAVLMAAPQSRGCEVKLSVSYKGQDGIWGRNWFNLESSGLLENRMLDGLRFTKSAQAERRRFTGGGGSRRAVSAPVNYAPTIIGGDSDIVQ
jgi:hypothetical protein